MALTFSSTPSWLHEAFFSPQSFLHPAWDLLRKWKEPATEEEAEIQLMVSNSGRHVSGWKTNRGASTPTATPVRQWEGCKKILSSEKGKCFCRERPQLSLSFLPTTAAY